MVNFVLLNNKPVTSASVMHELTDLKDRFEKISFLAEDVKRVENRGRKKQHAAKQHRKKHR